MSAEKKNYAAFANVLSSIPDTLAVKRFRELQIRNLLFYQAELAHLGQELEELEQRDAKDALNAAHVPVNNQWTPSMAQDPPSTPGQATTVSLYSEKMIRIRRTLASYNEAVEQYRRLDDIPCPHRSDIKAIYDWLNTRNRGAYFLRNTVEDVWSRKISDTETVPADVDDFYGFEESSGLAFSVGTVFASIQRLFRCGAASNQPHYVDTSASGALDRSLSTIIASVLPVLPIVVFYFVKRLLVRIGLILVFTAVFAATLVMGLQLKPDTTLGITTAIAAIQVVYVGTTTNTTSS